MGWWEWQRQIAAGGLVAVGGTWWKWKWQIADGGTVAAISLSIFPCTACTGSLVVTVWPGILLLEMCMEGCDINVTTRYTWTSRLLFV